MNQEKQNSLLQNHLKGILIDQNLMPADEVQRLNQYSIPPLVLTRQKRINWSLFFIPSAVICALLLLLPIWQEDSAIHTEDLFTTKGSTQVNVFYQRNNSILPLKQGELLQNKDKITYRFLASESSYVYTTVINNKNANLLNASAIIKNMFKVEQGSSQDFKESFELVGKNEHEKLVIIYCKKPFKNEVDLQNFIKDLIDKKNTPTTLCKNEVFQLR